MHIYRNSVLYAMALTLIILFSEFRMDFDSLSATKKTKVMQTEIENLFHEKYLLSSPNDDEKKL